MDSVKLNRQKYIGGSDIPIILGISKFKTRFQLLMEKAELVEPPNFSTPYIQYGNDMEDNIREHINTLYEPFQPSVKIIDHFRYNADGTNSEMVLEVKTTSDIKNSLEEYEVYLSQLLFGMYLNNLGHGVLAVYERPKDLSLELDEERLKIYEVFADDHATLLAKILNECKAFWEDLQRLKANPLLTEQDFMPTELVAITEKLVTMETELAKFKKLETQYKELKEQLYQAMLEKDIKTWEMYNGTKITLVKETAPSTKLVFDEDTFKAFHGDLYNEYQTQKEVSGRKGFVKITVKK